jgi:hypothetical protein
MRKGKVYDFLDSTGLLARGNREEIEQAKKRYWQQVRKDWKTKKRHEQKSYTIFFTNQEQKKIVTKAKQLKESINGYIKSSALKSLNESDIIGKKLIGEIRSILISNYFAIEGICDEDKISKVVTTNILQQIESAEKKILNVLINKSVES